MKNPPEKVIAALYSNFFLENGTITPLGFAVFCFIFVCFFVIIYYTFRLFSFVFRYYPEKWERISLHNSERAKKAGYILLEEFSYSWLKGVSCQYKVFPSVPETRVSQLEERVAQLEARVSQLEGRLAQKDMNGTGRESRGGKDG